MIIRFLLIRRRTQKEPKQAQGDQLKEMSRSGLGWVQDELYFSFGKGRMPEFNKSQGSLF